jgi:hypothetical protein
LRAGLGVQVGFFRCAEAVLPDMADSGDRRDHGPAVASARPAAVGVCVEVRLRTDIVAGAVVRPREPLSGIRSPDPVRRSGLLGGGVFWVVCCRLLLRVRGWLLMG